MIKKEKQKKVVVVFGIFDGIHEGHRSLFSQARLRSLESFGGQTKDIELIVIVGRDSSSLKWKGKKPKHSEQERLDLLKKEKDVDDAVLGDEKSSSYAVLREVNPHIICLGYDQDALGKDVKAFLAKNGRETPVVRLLPFHPHLYHSSKLA